MTTPDLAGLCERPSRRMSIRLSERCVASFTADGSQSDAEALAVFRKMQERVITGHTRRIVSVDGPPGPKYRINHEPGLPVFTKIRTPGLTRRRIVWAVRVIRSYADAYLTRLAPRTIRRAEVRNKLAELDAAIATHLARTALEGASDDR